MLLLADFTLGNLLVAMIAFFFLFLAVWMFIAVFADIFSRRDLSGWGKAGWTLLIFIIPLIGILIYLIARPAELGRERPGGAP
jgi:Phospholipase_D-nuclease N-terminal